MQWRIIGNTTQELSGRAPFDVVSVDGVGLSAVRRIVERGPFQVGVTDVGYRHDERSINMVLVSASASKANADAARDALFRLLRPSDAPLTLECTRDDNAVRRIDVHVVGVVDAAANAYDRIGAMQRYALQLMAPFPYWRAPGAQFWLTLGADDPQQSGSNSSSGYEVPTEVPTITVQSSGLDFVFPLSYEGSADSFPLLTVFGPASGIVIENETAGTTLSLPNLSLSAGQYIDIDLAFSAKTVLRDNGSNQIAQLATTSDIVTWRLIPGLNNIRFTVGSAATAATGLKITYVVQYISL